MSCLNSGVSSTTRTRAAVAPPDAAFGLRSSSFATIVSASPVFDDPRTTLAELSQDGAECHRHTLWIGRRRGPAKP
jgi:hypothetical protein